MSVQPAAGYPLHRPRRVRGHPRLRDLVRETQLAVNDLIYPLFVYHGRNLRREIPSMPGQYQLSLDRLGETLAEVSELGIPGIILFGIPEHKDARGSSAARDDGIVQEAIRLDIADPWPKSAAGSTSTTTRPCRSWSSRPRATPRRVLT
jgi:porphobilinogen synthase